MAVTSTDWKDEAKSLRRQGLTEAEIAEAVGRARSTVHEAVKDVAVNGNGASHEMPDPGEVTPAELDRIAGLEADRAEARAEGPTPGQLDIDGNEAPEIGEPPVEEIIVRGTTPLDFFNAGGKLPNKASLRFTGGKVGLEQGTAFRKGDVVRFEGYATVVAATPRDKRDRATRQVLECELQIHAEIDDLRLKAE